MDTPSCVIFDFGNVIAHFDKNPVWEGLSKLTGRSISPEEAENRVVKSGLEAQFDRGEIDIDQFLSRICQSLRLPKEKKADIEKLWRSVFTAPNQTVIDLIRLIRERGEYRLVLASNTNAIHYDQIKSQFAQELLLFDGIVLSYDIGSVKPESVFFEHCIKAAQCDSAQCVYVDDLRPLCKVARVRFGIEAVWYNPNVELKPLLEEVGVYADKAPHPADRERLLQVYQQRFLHYRHLDTLRWQVPVLVVALGGVVLGFAERQRGWSVDQPNLALSWMLFFFGIFAGLCSYYLSRISRHHEANTAALQNAARRLRDWSIPTSTTARSPYLSAATWFTLFTSAISGGFVGVSLWLFARYFVPLGDGWGIGASLGGIGATTIFCDVYWVRRRQQEKRLPGKRIL